MPDILRTLRDSVDRTTFEAKKLYRSQTEQGQLKRLQDNRQSQLSQLGEAVWNLYLAGQISEPSLVDHCVKIQVIETEIAKREQTIEAIKHEQPPEPPTCSTCSQVMSHRDAFCPNCGAAVNANQTLALPGPEPVVTCPHCSNNLRPGATFCGGCGEKVEI